MTPYAFQSTTRGVLTQRFGNTVNSSIHLSIISPSSNPADIAELHQLHTKYTSNNYVCVCVCMYLSSWSRPEQNLPWKCPIPQVIQHVSPEGALQCAGGLRTPQPHRGLLPGTPTPLHNIPPSTPPPPPLLYAPTHTTWNTICVLPLALSAAPNRTMPHWFALLLGLGKKTDIIDFWSISFTFCDINS